jgi:hypothetical protein
MVLLSMYVTTYNIPIVLYTYIIKKLKSPLQVRAREGGGGCDLATVSFSSFEPLLVIFSPLPSRRRRFRRGRNKINL